jgi:hypothetical protein
MSQLVAPQRLLGATTRSSPSHRTFGAAGWRAAGRPAPAPCRSQPQSTVVTDAAVPEGHKGLHGFLYGEGGAERHDTQGYQFRKVLRGAGATGGSVLLHRPALAPQT